MDREHQSRQGHDLDHLAGMPVFSADNQRLGTIDGVVGPAGATSERFMIVKPAARSQMDGVDQLYVPESEIQTVDHDRVILETPKASLPTRKWSAPPAGPRRS
jgi:rRNA processing protein Gar1